MTHKYTLARNPTFDHACLAININDLDELAKLFSEAIKLTREIILNPTFINFIITNQQLLLKIIELQAGNDINIYAIFQYSMNVNGSQIGSRDPTKQYLIDNYQIVENLIDMRRNIPINILIDLIREILQTPNAATFINDIITSQRLLAYLKNNKPLTAELVILVRLAPLLLPIAKYKDDCPVPQPTSKIFLLKPIYFLNSRVK